MLVGTRAVVLPSTLHSLAEGPETQQVFGGSGPSSFLGDPRRVLSWVLFFASCCVTPLRCSFLYLPFPDCNSCSGWRAEWQEGASKP